MERKELIQWVKDTGVKTEKPAHMMSTADLQKVYDEASAEKEEAGEEKEVTMKSRILELGRQGLTKKAIESQMKEEGFSRIRYAYIFIVLKDNSVVVPKAKPLARKRSKPAPEEAPGQNALESPGPVEVTVAEVAA